MNRTMQTQQSPALNKPHVGGEIYLKGVVFLLEMNPTGGKVKQESQLLDILPHLWAKTKPWQSVAVHGMTSGFTAQCLTRRFLCAGTRKQLARDMHLDENQLLSFIGYLASLHDIGKIHYSFQSMDADMKAFLKDSSLQMMDIPGLVFRHEIESEKAVNRIWNASSRDRRTADTLASVLAAHHQGKQRSFSQPSAQGPWLELQALFEADMRRCFLADASGTGQDFFPRLDKTQAPVISALLLGLVILADWIASSEYFQHAQHWENLPDSARSRAEEFLVRSGLAQAFNEY